MSSAFAAPAKSAIASVEHVRAVEAFRRRVSGSTATRGSAPRRRRTARECRRDVSSVSASAEAESDPRGPAPPSSCFASSAARRIMTLRRTSDMSENSSSPCRRADLNAQLPKASHREKSGNVHELVRKNFAADELPPRELRDEYDEIVAVHARIRALSHGGNRRRPRRAKEWTRCTVSFPFFPSRGYSLSRFLENGNCEKM